jgi:hypothetical protein
MRSIPGFLFCLLCLGPGHLSGQDTIRIGQFFAKKAGGRVILRGVVSNPDTGEPLAGASILRG